MRIVIAVSIFFVPHVVNTAHRWWRRDQSQRRFWPTDPRRPHTTLGAVATAAAADPGVVARLAAISARDEGVIGALQAHPAIAHALSATQAAGATLSAAQLAAVKAALGPQVFAALLEPQTQRDLAYLSTAAPKALGAANFAAISAPTPALPKALTTLAVVGPGVQRAAAIDRKRERSRLIRLCRAVQRD